MNLSFDIQHEVIPGGTSSIVQLTIKTEFTVPTEGAPKHAEDVVVEVAHRLTGKDEAFVRERIQEQFWLDNFHDLPSEPDRP